MFILHSIRSGSDAGKEKAADSPVATVRSRPKSEFIKGKQIQRMNF